MVLPSEQWQSLFSAVLIEHKAREVISLPVHKLTTLTDYMLICTATSERHSKALADYILKSAKAQSLHPLGVEGEKEGAWILIDLADIVIHIMLEPVRAFYELEKLWTPL